MSENTLRTINVLANLVAALTLLGLIVVLRAENKRLRDQMRSILTATIRPAGHDDQDGAP